MDTNQNCHYLYSTDARLKPVSLRRSSLLRLIETLQFWWDRSEQRRHLARLDDRMLRDIGVSHAEAHRESQKWFWQD
jgi:uncharacterized protein YjiS (DUF1127 family)